MGIHSIGSPWTWTPTKKMKTYGDKSLLGGLITYKSRGAGVVLGARLTVGLHLLNAKKPMEQMKVLERNVIEVVKNHRILQSGDPGSTFQAGQGLYKAPDGIVEEPAVQVLITHLTDESPEEFRANAKDLGEFLATVFGQNEVLIEILVNNVIDEVVGATRNPEYV